uniref:Protein phosphatase 1 regulatory inhibitor subunit 1C n=2 Tax=Canis lupus familiaris TaxID=9615 RepID=A0A8P0TI84_CANLF
MEPNSPKKIQFAVPLFQSQIAPEAAEQIRKRRPTPASLVILNEHNPPEIDDKRVTNTQAESQNASPKQRKQSVYTPPAMKACQFMDSPPRKQDSTVHYTNLAMESVGELLRGYRQDNLHEGILINEDFILMLQMRIICML